MPVYGQGFVPGSGAIANELTAVTRRAFVPKLVVQIYNAAPFLSMAMRNAQQNQAMQALRQQQAGPPGAGGGAAPPQAPGMQPGRAA